MNQAIKNAKMNERHGQMIDDIKFMVEFFKENKVWITTREVVRK